MKGIRMVKSGPVFVAIGDYPDPRWGVDIHKCDLIGFGVNLHDVKRGTPGKAQQMHYSWYRILNGNFDSDTGLLTITDPTILDSGGQKGPLGGGEVYMVRDDGLRVHFNLPDKSQ